MRDSLSERMEAGTGAERGKSGMNEWKNNWWKMKNERTVLNEKNSSHIAASGRDILRVICFNK